MLIYLGLNGFLLLRQGQAARSEAHGGIQQKELTAAVQEAERLVRLPLSKKQKSIQSQVNQHIISTGLGVNRHY